MNIKCCMTYSYTYMYSFTLVFCILFSWEKMKTKCALKNKQKLKEIFLTDNQKNFSSLERTSLY